MPRALWPALLMVAILTTTTFGSSSGSGNDADAAEAEADALTLLNPWLSACDLVGVGSEDLQGHCTVLHNAPLPKHNTDSSPGSNMGPCPVPCSSASASAYADNTTATTNQYQCLEYLDEAHKASLCLDSVPWERRHRALQRLRLRHCCEHSVPTAFRPRELRQLRQGGAPCRRLLHSLLQVDKLARRISCEFTEVLTRYDCAQSYSIVYHCDDCKEAYRRWVCSSLVPLVTTSGGRVRPCRSVCQAVEQRCPYLLPGDRAPAHPTQYAGEPTFLCLDPNIPETGMQRVRSSHGDDSCCYTYCGGPGRPACVRCPSSSANTSWDAPACGAAGTRTSPPCRVIAAAGSLSRHTLGLAPILLLMLLHLVLAKDSLALLLMCCVRQECACASARTTSAWTS